MPPKSTQFGRTALPFLAMMGLGSWGLAQFLKMPIDAKDARAKDKREKKHKSDKERKKHKKHKHKSDKERKKRKKHKHKH